MTDEEALTTSDKKWIDDLFMILHHLKMTYPQSKAHNASVTVKTGSIEIVYSISVTRGDL